MACVATVDYAQTGDRGQGLGRIKNFARIHNSRRNDAGRLRRLNHLCVFQEEARDGLQNFRDARAVGALEVMRRIAQHGDRLLQKRQRARRSESYGSWANGGCNYRKCATSVGPLRAGRLGSTRIRGA